MQPSWPLHPPALPSTAKRSVLIQVGERLYTMTMVSHGIPRAQESKASIDWPFKEEGGTSLAMFGVVIV